MNTQFAYQAGVETAEYINGSADRDNWSRLSRGDDLPTEDYVQISQHYGFNDLSSEQIQEIEQAYRNGFNSAFVPDENDE